MVKYHGDELDDAVIAESFYIENWHDIHDSFSRFGKDGSGDEHIRFSVRKMNLDKEIGYADVVLFMDSMQNKKLYLKRIQVQPELRKRGIGTFLLGKILFLVESNHFNSIAAFPNPQQHTKGSISYGDFCRWLSGFSFGKGEELTMELATSEQQCLGKR